jgi:hypothetical protein
MDSYLFDENDFKNHEIKCLYLLMFLKDLLRRGIIVGDIYIIIKNLIIIYRRDSIEYYNDQNEIDKNILLQNNNNFPLLQIVERLNINFKMIENDITTLYNNNPVISNNLYNNFTEFKPYLNKDITSLLIFLTDHQKYLDNLENNIKNREELIRKTNSILIYTEKIKHKTKSIKCLLCNELHHYMNCKYMIEKCEKCHIYGHFKQQCKVNKK